MPKLTKVLRIPDAERLAYSVNEWAAKVGVARSTVYSDIKAGKLRVIRIGSVIRITK